MSKARDLIESVVNESVVFMKDDRGTMYQVKSNDAERMLINAGIPFQERKYYRSTSKDVPPIHAAPTPSALSRIGKKLAAPHRPSKPFDPEKELRAQLRREAAANKKFHQLVKREVRNWMGAASDLVAGQPDTDPDDLIQSAASDAAFQFMQRSDVQRLVQDMNLDPGELLGLEGATADDFYEAMRKGTGL